jgi:hypothetical protein
VAQQHQRAQLESEAAQRSSGDRTSPLKTREGDTATPESLKSPSGENSERSSEKSAASEVTSPASNAASAKKYQRLSNRSFMGAKAIAAMTAASTRPTPEAIARARSANPNQQFAIVHGKIVPILSSADTDAKHKSEQYAQYIREYSQSHCINPFRIRDSQSYSHSQSHNRRRWVHVFPQGTPRSFSLF